MMGDAPVKATLCRTPKGTAGSGSMPWHVSGCCWVTVLGVGAGMCSGGLSLSWVQCRGAVVVALLFWRSTYVAVTMAREGRGWDMRWCEHHFRNCLLWGSESGTGLLASLVQSWCV